MGISDPPTQEQNALVILLLSQGYSSRKLLGNYMVVPQILFINLTLLCHICWRVYSATLTYDHERLPPPPSPISSLYMVESM